MNGYELDAVLELPGGFVMIGPAVAAAVGPALRHADKVHRMDGIRTPPWLVALQEATTRSASFAYESAKARKPPLVPQSTQIGSGQLVGAGRVANSLHCSPQWARSLLRRGAFVTARQVGRTWLVDADELAAWVIARAEGEAAA
jgi:hypothetical protein